MVREKMKPSKTRTRGVVFVTLLWALQSALRLIFGYINVAEGSLLDVEVSHTVFQTLVVLFFVLGISGFIATFGLWQMKKWGFWGIILVSGATIIFDVWGVTIQFTAAMGFFVPVISILYLFVRKSHLLQTMT